MPKAQSMSFLTKKNTVLFNRKNKNATLSPFDSNILTFVLSYIDQLLHFTGKVNL